MNYRLLLSSQVDDDHRVLDLPLGHLDLSLETPLPRDGPTTPMWSRTNTLTTFFDLWSSVTMTYPLCGCGPETSVLNNDHLSFIVQGRGERTEDQRKITGDICPSVDCFLSIITHIRNVARVFRSVSSHLFSSLCYRIHDHVVR